MDNNRFIFVIPCFNAEETVERMLQSVFMQTYKNWTILMRDDMSTDSTVSKIRDTCAKHNIDYYYQEKLGDLETETNKPLVFVISNQEKFWEVRNVLAMLNHEIIEENDIICRLDGDDFLCDLYALEDINSIYKEVGCEVLWTMHRWTGTEKVVHDERNGVCQAMVSFLNISNLIPNNADPYRYNWVTSHFKTFKKHLIQSVNDENFRGEDGEYIRRAGDQAIFLPVLHNSKKRVFMPKVTYSYTIDPAHKTFHTDDAKFQKAEGEFLRRRGYVE